ncbi:glycosyltransferase 87 family protein [Streptomyces scopuliridis]|uniref:Glycosyltransferase 87 family protein n=1 Tax=Streptomyces scopuliridis TaxID=452529 RepID=A0ACD4ZY49_9ACTN|nr:glycosyltransferase 87 family protein [Streptomyces scopuliridis]WSB38802.1 glycosyltransferase 87 family protein [Streptomyces scopuliridis]WSC03241.1 glycosyltransferase 87 family protein [Streptomyces scopuliridis]WSC10880.1 glycosyltransferase 87 family protein [Streptomyces scopuliridis]
MAGAHGTRFPVAVWALTRAALLLCVFKVVTLPGPDVTGDVAVIYQGWYEVLKTGTYPLDDVTWQYPPAAALAIGSPAMLPFLGYASAFFVLALLCDAVAFGLLLYAGGRTGRSIRGAWVWVAGVPLLGPTAYARYDLMVTAVAVAALLAGVRRPRLMGALAGFGALLKVWPVLLLVGTPRGRATRRSWATASVVAAVLAVVCSAAMPGALAFLTFQRDRGTEIESLGALVFQVARHYGWNGSVLLNYGSVEFVGPYVPLVSNAALALTVLAFGWLLVWRLRARAFSAGTPYDAAFAAVLLFTTTSRVISPQYMLWLVGLAAVCLTLRASRMGLPAWLVVAATAVTLLEFPLLFSHVVAGDPMGILLLAVRNGLLVAATLTACVRLWRDTVSGPRRRDGDALAVRPDADAQSRANVP